MYKTKTIEELANDIKQGTSTIIDVREVEEYQNGHIENATNLPLSELTQLTDQLDSNQSYDIICRSGGRSAIACEFLSAQGFDVTNVTGGMLAWMGEVVVD